MLQPCSARSGSVGTLGELMMVLELHRQGLTVTAIAQQVSLDFKTVRRYIARGLDLPSYEAAGAGVALHRLLRSRRPTAGPGSERAR